MSQKKVAIIGTGPYGLSLAAHLNARGVDTQLFGAPMEYWRKMPAAFFLKSIWSASTLSDPTGEHSLDSYTAKYNFKRQDPVPLEYFINYSSWFQKSLVPNIDTTYVQKVTRDGKQFHLDLVDGRSMKADKVVVAAGISSFTKVPGYAKDLPKSLASHTQDHTDLTPFKGRNVAVLGSGQSALQYAAMLHEAGANVEIICRGTVVWVNRKLYDNTGPFKHVFYPKSDVGPAGINWLIHFPLLFKNLPDNTRLVMDKRAMRPAGAKWLRPRVEGQIPVTENTSILKATEKGKILELTLSDGTTREVDYLFMGTGFKVDLHKFSFLDSSITDEIVHSDGYPKQNEWFESSIPNLYFIGAIAGHTFGPICRFVAGARVPAKQITKHITSAV